MNILKKSSDKCVKLYRTLNKHNLILRTFVNSLISKSYWYSNKCSLKWKMIFTPHHRLLFQLTPLKNNVELLATPKAMMPLESENCKVVNGRIVRESGNDFGMNLAVQISMLPTPSAGDGLPQSPLPEVMNAIWGNPSPRISDGRKKFSMLPTPTTDNGHERSDEYYKNRIGKHQIDLQGEITMLPTPARRDYKGAGTRAGHTTPCIVEGRTDSKTGLKLQPKFVEWMMGFPLDWTDLSIKE